MSEHIIKKLSEEEHSNEIEQMKSFDVEKPQVGIFWYDADKKELFFVETADFDSASQPNANGKVTITKLHKNVWQKQFYKGKIKGDYKMTPRGRIFYDIKKKDFDINIGSWLNDLEDSKSVIDIIKQEFNLQNQKVNIVVDEHWEIGSGFEF
jgi:hypothetical protein